MPSGDRTAPPGERLDDLRETLRTRPGLLAALVALAGGVAVYLVAHNVFPYHSTNHDEAVYLQQAGMLLEGRLYLRPPVEGAFRPWFFVESSSGLYPKYAPLPAATFAVGMALGDPRLSLALTGAAVAAGVYLLTREAFHADDPATLSGRATALLAAALTVASPQFLVETSVFLSYAPTAAWNLLFAFAYLRADRLADDEPAGERVAGHSRRVLAWAAAAGLGVGMAFFARPYTAVLFAAPFVVHALWTLVRTGDGPRGPVGVDRRALVRLLPTAALGVAGVAATLAYNAVVTGDPLVFPYEAFAPRDGLGFGTREIAGYSRDYTPALALEANARVLAELATRWAVAGPLGVALAAVGVGSLLARGREADPRKLAVAGLFVSVAAGNVYFWGNLNVLGELADPNDGLIHFLGPYYHYDLLAPLSAFGAAGVLRVRDLLRDRLPAMLAARGVSRSVATRVGLAALLVGWSVLGATAATTAAGPLAENRDTSRNLAAAYAPFESGEHDLSNAVVFLPTPYGDWLNHPFQVLRNDPGYDGRTVYAMRERQFAVVDAFPDRRYYRYAYRGEWAPYAGISVDPVLRRVRHVRGEAVTLTSTLGVPPGADRVSIRLGNGDDGAYFSVAGVPDRLALSLRMEDGTATLTGSGVSARSNGSVPLPERGRIVVTVNVEYNPAYALTYRLVLPVAQDGGDVRALSPFAEACRETRRCGGEAAYVPGTLGPEVTVTTGLEAANRSA